MTDLLKKLSQPQHKYLVFTSAGDNSKLAHWLNGSKNFDLWISYFGDEENKYSDVADYYMMRKGGKFPALHYSYKNWQSILSQYEAIFVLDDDLIFSGSDISRLFNIMKKEDLWLLQPAFDKRGKISFKLNEVHPFSYLRYTNFVENTCPMFTQAELVNFIEVFDPSLNGWGIDFWYCELISNKDEKNNKIAIVDLISCINPRDNQKIGNKREIDQLQTRDERIAIWENIKIKNSLQPQYNEIEYKQIKSYFSLEVILKSLRVFALKYSYITYKKLTGGKIYPVK